MQTKLERGIQVNGGRFDFDDGGTYCGGWEDGKAHGHGVCTGPKGQGEYSGSWHYGFEVSGVYTWPSGSTFEGHWQNGKRHGLGVETRGRWVYRGEWTQGFKGRYGVRQSATSGAKYEGTWANGLQDGYGSETYADNGTFQGQWLRGMRHGYGVRTSAPFGLASFYRGKTARASLTSLRSENATDPASERDRKMDDCRGGFVLKAKSDEPPARRRSLVEKSTNLKKTILQGFRIKKQRSTGDIDKRGTGSIRSTGSSTSWVSQESGHSGATNTGSAHTDSNVSFVSQDDVIDANVTETYMGEWKNDKRCGFGISERSDGLKYEGEWYNNKKYGYGLTTFRDQTREEGKYKNNVLITSNKKKHLFLIRSVKFRERIDSAVSAAVRASQIALQKADIAISRTATARGKAEQADVAALHAREDSDFARMCAKQFAPDFHQPGKEPAFRGIEQLIKKNSFDRQSQDMQLTSKARDDGHALRSKALYIRKEGSEQDLNSSNYALSGSDEHSSPGGLRMSLDYGNPRFHDVDHLPPGEEPAYPSANQKPGAHSNYHQHYHNQQMNQGTHLRNGGHDHAMANRTNFSTNPASVNDATTAFSLRGSIRRGKNLSIRGNNEDSRYTLQHAMNDHFDHYKVTEPSPHTRSCTPSSSRAGSSTTVASALAFAAAVKTVGRAAACPSPTVSANRYGTDWTPDSGVSDDMDTDESPTRPSRRSTLPNLYAEMMAANEAESRRNEEQNLRLRMPLPSADIPPPSLPVNSPVRTASLYVANSPAKKIGGAGGGGGISMPSGPPKRKKSLPDIQQLPKQMSTMSREEVSVLSSARREEVRRQQEEAERYRANPLLYIFSPNVKDWFSRQQLMMLVLFVNISLAIMFFKLLT